jgi:DNA-binding GntR family transcriptional regulator
VYTVLDYLRAGRTRDWIAALLHLSSEQVQAAMDYIRDHDTQVNAEYEAIVARIEQGNPAQVEALLRANRAKVKARLSQPQTPSR